MPAVPLTPEMIELLLVLCQESSDTLNTRLARSFTLPATGSYLGRTTDAQDVKIAEELSLTHATMRVLEAAK